MWRGRNNTVRVDGMAGQFVVLFPDKDAYVVFTANARDTQKELNLMHDYLFPAIQSDKALSSNPVANKEIQSRTKALRIPVDDSQTMNPDLESRSQERNLPCHRTIMISNPYILHLIKENALSL